MRLEMTNVQRGLLGKWRGLRVANGIEKFISDQTCTIYGLEVGTLDDVRFVRAELAYE